MVDTQIVVGLVILGGGFVAGTILGHRLGARVGAMVSALEARLHAIEQMLGIGSGTVPKTPVAAVTPASVSTLSPPKA
jgi:hypothetical protein